MENKTILFFINALAVGGAEKVFIKQAEALEKSGWNVHFALVFREGELRSNLTIPKENVHVLGMRSIFDISGYFRARTLIAKVRPAIVYSTLNEANAIARILSLISPRFKLISREANMADIKPMIYKALDILLGFRSSVVIAVSGAVRDSLAAYAPYLKSRTRILYNSVVVPDQITARDWPRGGEVRLLSVGSLDAKKDHEVLVRSMQHLPERFRLTIIGKGKLESHLKSVAEEMGVKGRIDFKGTVSPKDMPAQYAAHHLFVLPSKREGCPNVVLEAYASALPVVAFNIAGMNEFVTESAGILVSERTPQALASAIEQITKSDENLQRMGKAGYELVKSQYTPEKKTHELESILKTTAL